MTRLLALLLLVLAGCASAPPPAVPSGWQAVAPGLLYWRGEPGLHALKVDLRLRRLQLTPYAERGRAVDGFSAAAQALAVVNVSFFDRRFHARGHTVSEGEAWPEPLNLEASPLLACDVQQRCQLDLEAPYPLPAATRTALAGTPWLIRAGQPRTPADDAGCPGLCAATHPRTALGLSADGRTLILLLAEGRREGVPGLTLADTARRLLELGAHEGLNLDGGGSSSLLLNGTSVMQRPANEPQLRRVANALLIL
jgi:hypothetical protein